MNPRIEKISGEIARLRDKVTDYQSRLRELERQKTELENADIVALVRDVEIPPEKLEAFIRSFIQGAPPHNNDKGDSTFEE